MQTQTTTTKPQRQSTGSAPLPSQALTASPQQIQCVKLAADGLSNKEIASELGISKRTVDQHLYLLYCRMDGRRSRMAVVNEFRRRGLLN